MNVYIEYVIIDNLIIDYMLLKATFTLTGNAVNKGRLFLCSMLGTIMALIYPLLGDFELLIGCIKVLTGIVMVLLASRFNALKGAYTAVVVFFFATFITGGAIIGIFSLLGIDYTGEICIAIVFVPAYLVLKFALEVIRFFTTRNRELNLTYKVELTLFIGGETICGKGFMDTGNGVFDGGSPVVFCSKAFFMRVIGDNILRLNTKKIAVTTVNGTSEKTAIKIAELKIYYGAEPNIFNNVTLCVSAFGFNDGYDLILNPAFSKESGYEQVERKIDKVS